MFIISPFSGSEDLPADQEASDQSSLRLVWQKEVWFSCALLSCVTAAVVAVAFVGFPCGYHGNLLSA